jgi:hypothetical protein
MTRLEPMPWGDPDRFATRLPPGLRSVGAVPLLHAVAGLTAHEVVALGLVEQQAAVVTTMDGRWHLVQSSAGSTLTVRQVLAARVARMDTRTAGPWDEPMSALTLDLADGAVVDLLAVGESTDPPWHDRLPDTAG